MIFDQSHNNITVICHGCFADDHDISVIDPRFDHRVALDLKRVMFALSGQHLAWNGHVMGHMRNCFDRDTSRDPPHDRQFNCLNRLDRDGRRRRLVRTVPVNHTRGEAGLATQSFGKLHDFDGSGAMRKTADETAFFQRGDQTVDA